MIEMIDVVNILIEVYPHISKDDITQIVNENINQTLEVISRTKKKYNDGNGVSHELIAMVIATKLTQHKE